MLSNPATTETLTTFQQLQQLISEVTGNDPETITHNTYLEEFSLAEFPRIIMRINRQFEINLNPKKVIDEYETVEELATLVDEETELG